MLVRKLRMDRVSVDELRGMIEGAKVSAILDVRSPISQELTGRIPGARVVDIDAMDRLDLLPTDDEVIVYCACPNEESAVRVAQRLRAAGFKRVRPLAGGIDAWLAAGLEVER
jgi:rhodanese-related sulfurtransferase